MNSSHSMPPSTGHSRLHSRQNIMPGCHRQIASKPRLEMHKIRPKRNSSIGFRKPGMKWRPNVLKQDSRKLVGSTFPTKIDHTKQPIQKCWWFFGFVVVTVALRVLSMSHFPVTLPYYVIGVHCCLSSRILYIFIVTVFFCWNSIELCWKEALENQEIWTIQDAD